MAEYPHRVEVDHRLLLATLDHEIGIVDDEVRTKAKMYPMNRGIFEAIGTGQSCQCEVVAAYYKPVSVANHPIMNSGNRMCAHCYGDLGRDGND